MYAIVVGVLQLTNSFKLISWENSLSEYEHKSVAATFACQLEDLDRQCPDASHFLRVLAFLDPESIPLEMLTTGAKLVSESRRPPSPHTDAQVGLKRQSFISIIQNKLLRRGKATTISQRVGVDSSPVMPPTYMALLALVQNPIALRNALSHLQDRSLVAIQHNSPSSTLRIHDLVQLVVLETMKGSRGYSESFEFAVDLACSALSQIKQLRMPEWWPQCEALVPHIQSLTLEQATSTRAKRQLLWANRRCGWYLTGRGRYVEAEQLCRTNLSESERFFGVADVDTLHMMSDLAWIYLFQGRYTDAEPLFDRVLRNRNKWLGSEHRDTLDSMHRLAVLYYHQHRYHDAEELLKRTLRTQERQFGSEDLDTLYTMHMLARVHRSQQRHTDAEAIFKRVLLVETKIFGSEHPITLTSMHELALVHHSQQRYDEAQALFTQVLLRREKHYGSRHPETLSTKDCLARVYNSHGKYHEAEELLVDVLVGHEEIFGPSHPFTQVTIQLLASVYMKLDRSADAALLKQRIVPSPR